MVILHVRAPTFNLLQTLGYTALNFMEAFKDQVDFETNVTSPGFTLMSCVNHQHILKIDLSDCLSTWAAGAKGSRVPGQPGPHGLTLISNNEYLNGIPAVSKHLSPARWCVVAASVQMCIELACCGLPGYLSYCVSQRRLAGQDSLNCAEPLQGPVLTLEDTWKADAHPSASDERSAKWLSESCGPFPPPKQSVVLH